MVVVQAVIERTGSDWSQTWSTRWSPSAAAGVRLWNWSLAVAEWSGRRDLRGTTRNGQELQGL